MPSPGSTVNAADGDFLVDVSTDATREWRRRRGIKPSVQPRRVPGTFPCAYQLAADLPDGWGADAVALLGELASARRARLDAPPLETPGLTPPQMVGAGRLASSDGMILGDEMGAGKTVQACAAAEAVASSAARAGVVVVCPLQAVRGWTEHLAAWAPSLPPAETASGGRADAALERASIGGAVGIVPWSQVSRLAMTTYWPGSSGGRDRPGPLNRRWGLLIVDEAHRAKNPRSQQARAMAGLEAEKTWLLTGTPVANSPVDLWALLRLIDRRSWASKWRFVDDWCQTRRGEWMANEITGWAEHRRDEFSSVVADRVLRRSMEEVLGRRFPQVRKTLWVAELPEQRRIRRELVDDWRADVDGGSLTPANALARGTQLYAIAQGTPSLDGDGRVEISEPAPKVDALLDLLGGMDEPVVAFSRSKALALMAAARAAGSLRGWRVHCITGDDPPPAREVSVEDFSRGGRALLVCTTRTMSEAVNLTAARVCVMLSGTYSLIDTLQAEARIRRPGQRAPATLVIDVVTEGTIDEAVRGAVRDKRQSVEMIDWGGLVCDEMAS